MGLLKEGPKHGYEIKKTIEEVLSIFTNVDIWIDAHDALSDVTATRQLIRMLSNPNEKHDN